MTLQKRIFVFVLCIGLLSFSYSLGETTLSLAGCDPNSAEYSTFTEAHPELTVKTESNIYLSTNEIVDAFSTGAFPFDTFAMTSSSFDIKQMIDKGYCASLMDSALLSAEIAKMYPSVQEVLTQNENIYGAPFFCYIGYYAYSPEAWALAGLSEEDVPSSFEETLDFLEAWVERIVDHPEEEISVSNLFGQYGKSSYIGYLVDLLITNHIMQCNYANEPLRFDTPVFRELLERCLSIGADLYTYEPIEKGRYSLFEELHGMRQLAYLVPLRLTVDQPILIKGTLHLAFLNAGSEHQALATEYLENVVTCVPPEVGVYLYPDAKPVEDPQFKKNMDALQAEMETIEKKLNTETDMDSTERNTLQEQLETMKLKWENMSTSDDRYLITEKDLELYRTHGEHIYFQAPSIFDPSTPNGQNIKKLQDRFSTGELSVDEFIESLDDLA